jgi:hypothetical protein
MAKKPSGRGWKATLVEQGRRVGLGLTGAIGGGTAAGTLIKVGVVLIDPTGMAVGFMVAGGIGAYLAASVIPSKKNSKGKKG